MNLDICSIICFGQRYTFENNYTEKSIFNFIKENTWKDIWKIIIMLLSFFQQYSDTHQFCGWSINTFTRSLPVISVSHKMTC